MVTSRSLPRPGARPARTSHSSVTGKSGDSCWISPAMRDCGSNSTTTRASGRRRMSACSSVLPGQSPPTAFRCIPGAIIAGARIVALRLSAVTVVTMSAPATAPDLEAGQAEPTQVAHQLLGGERIGVVETQLADAEQVVEGDRLELALRAVADQRHHAAAGAGHAA